MPKKSKGNHFNGRVSFFKSLSNQFHNLLNPLQKDDPSRSSFALQQTEDKMINWFNIPDEGLSNGGLFEVKELEVTENGTYETKGEMYNKVTVNVEGGGGSSDFSTAEVTVNANKQFEFYVPLINEEHGYLGSYDNINPSESEILTVGLYKGKALTQFYTEGVASVSGNAQLNNNQILITGDCTITIS